MSRRSVTAAVSVAASVASASWWLAACAPPPGPGDGALGSIEQAMTICPAATVVEGIDVSGYQKNTDWAKVAADGRRFAIIKATEGTTYVNPMFARDWAATTASGVLRGAYQYFHADLDPVAQADFFVQTVAATTGVEAELPPMLDLEETKGAPAATVVKNALAWLARVEQLTGRKPFIYTYPSFWTSTLGDPAAFASWDLAIANYGVRCPNVPSTWSAFKVWQYSANGTVAGIAGGCDLDRWNGTLDELRAWGGGGAMPAPATTPAQVTGNDAIAVLDWSGDRHAEVFALADGGRIVHASTAGAASETWSPAAALDGGAGCGFAAGFWGGGWRYPEVFAPLGAGGTGHLWWAAGTWNTFKPFGTTALAHLQTTVGNDGRIEVYALDAAGAIEHDQWDTTKNDWTGWQTLGMPPKAKLATGVGAIVWTDGHTELFATDENGEPWHDWQDVAGGTWQGWHHMKGALASRPVPARFSDGHVEVFARALDDTLVRSTIEADAWTPFSPVLASARIAGEPSVIVNPAGNGGPPEAEVFARDDHGRVVHDAWSGTSYAGPKVLDGFVAAADPFAWVRADGHVDVFAIDAAGHLAVTSRDKSGAWTPWQNVADGIKPCATAELVAVEDAGSGRPVDGGSGGGPDAAGGAPPGGCSASGHGAPSSPLGLALAAIATALLVARRRR